MSNSKKEPLNSTERSDEIELGRLIGTLLDNKWLIIAVTLLFSIVGVVYSLFSTPIYRADALVQVEQNVGNSILNDISQVFPTKSPGSASEIELLQSRMVIGKTVQDLHLDIEARKDYFPLFGAGWSRLFNGTSPTIDISALEIPTRLYGEEIKLNVEGGNKYSIELPNGEIVNGQVGSVLNANGLSLLVTNIAASKGDVFIIGKRKPIVVINELRNRLSIEDKGKDTGVLSLSLEGSDPYKIREIVDSITQNYLLQNIERKSEEAGKSLIFLKQKLPEVRATLDVSESKLNKFRQENESVDLSLEAKAVLDNMLQLDSQLNELSFKETEISKLYTKEHPAYRALLEKRETLENDKNKLNKKIAALPETQQEILKLTRDVQAGQAIYMQLLNKEQELNISKASTVGNVRIVDSAATQPEPVKPKKALTLILATLIGLVSSITYVLLKALLHKGIENVEQLEEAGISVYASIPLSAWQKKKDEEFRARTKGVVKNTRTDQLIAVGNPADLAVEAIRSLRTSLHFAMMEARNNILMISGASPSIGKTFVSSNLAIVIAQSGLRVLLIDSDMRKGYSHVQFGLTWENGLSDILSGQIDNEQAIKKTVESNLDFISRGQIPPNPSELLMNQRFVELLKWAEKNYDLVLVDTPPILAVTDAAIIGHYVGTVLLVARYEVNSVKEVEVSIRRFEQSGVSIKGVILNAAVKKAANYYSYGNYQYSYDSDKDS